LELIRQFPLRRIKTAAEHVQATNLVLRLWSQPIDRGTSDYLDVLIDLIADYEKRSGFVLDTSDVTAADLVRHRLEEREMSVSALARQIRVPQSNLSQMLSGKRGWSKKAIREISKAFHIRAERFLK
jgi:antitoxin component HigA of HigAB toxin-antitoxin module